MASNRSLATILLTAFIGIYSTLTHASAFTEAHPRKEVVLHFNEPVPARIGTITNLTSCATPENCDKHVIYDDQGNSPGFTAWEEKGFDTELIVKQVSAILTAGTGTVVSVVSAENNDLYYDIPDTTHIWFSALQVTEKNNGVESRLYGEAFLGKKTVADEQFNPSDNDDAVVFVGWLDPSEISAVIAHEVGHTLGLLHVFARPTSVMSMSGIHFAGGKYIDHEGGAIEPPLWVSSELHDAKESPSVKQNGAYHLMRYTAGFSDSEVKAFAPPGNYDLIPHSSLAIRFLLGFDNLFNKFGEIYVFGPAASLSDDDNRMSQIAHLEGSQISNWIQSREVAVDSTLKFLGASVKGGELDLALRFGPQLAQSITLSEVDPSNPPMVSVVQFDPSSGEVHVLETFSSEQSASPIPALPLLPLSLLMFSLIALASLSKKIRTGVAQ